MDHDDDQDEKTAESQKQAMQLAHEGRLVQLAQHEAFTRGERVDFKNHQGTSHLEALDPSVFSRPKTTRLRFVDRYRFFDAVAESEGDLVQELLASGIDVNQRNEEGVTALHQCCIDNNLKMAAILLQHPGIDVNVQDCDWWTPLHAAAACGHWRLTNTLLSHGADATIVNSDGELPYDIAEGDRTKGILNDEMARLEMDEAKMEALRDAAEKNLLARINALIESRGNLDEKDLFGNTMLHCAASNGYLECIETLLQNKADIDSRDEDQNTPLHLAVFFSQFHAVEMLGKYGATLEVRNRHLETPLILTEDPMMLRLITALKSKQLSAELLAAAPRGRTHTAAKRRSTATKKDMQKMDLAAEFQKFSHYDSVKEKESQAAAAAASGPAPATGAAAVSVPSPEDVYSMPRTTEKKTATELLAAASAPAVAKHESSDNVVPNHPKFASHKPRKDSQAAIAIDLAEFGDGGNGGGGGDDKKKSKKKKKGGCVVS